MIGFKFKLKLLEYINNVINIKLLFIKIWFGECYVLFFSVVGLNNNIIVMIDRGIIKILDWFFFMK